MKAKILLHGNRISTIQHWFKAQFQYLFQENYIGWLTKAKTIHSKFINTDEPLCFSNELKTKKKVWNSNPCHQNHNFKLFIKVYPFTFNDFESLYFNTFHTFSWWAHVMNYKHCSFLSSIPITFLSWKIPKKRIFVVVNLMIYSSANIKHIPHSRTSWTLIS